MDCPKCKSSRRVKDGIIHGRQRYRCKECLYRYTVERKSDVKPAQVRRLALELYLEGLGFRSIGRILKISYGTVYAWVKRWSAHIVFPRRENVASPATLQDMLAYIESKKTAGQSGLLLIDLEKGISLISVDSTQKQQNTIDNME